MNILEITKQYSVPAIFVVYKDKTAYVTHSSNPSHYISRNIFFLDPSDTVFEILEVLNTNNSMKIRTKLRRYRDGLAEQGYTVVCKQNVGIPKVKIIETDAGYAVALCTTMNKQYVVKTFTEYLEALNYSKKDVELLIEELPDVV